MYVGENKRTHTSPVALIEECINPETKLLPTKTHCFAYFKPKTNPFLKKQDKCKLHDHKGQTF